MKCVIFVRNIHFGKKKKELVPSGHGPPSERQQRLVAALIVSLEERSPCYCDDEPIIMAVCLINDPLVLFQQRKTHGRL